MSERQVCVDCGLLSPETETNYTLIGAQHGWRLTRRYEPDGTAVAEWRCPSCWRAYKGAADEKSPPSTRRTSGRTPSSETRRAAPAASDEPDPTLVTGQAPPSVPTRGQRKS